MTITREQVADLQPGDVVEIRHEDHPGVVISGPLSIHAARGELVLGPITTVRLASGRSGWEGPDATLTVVSRAPRPLYVNHPRTKPVPGDVVRDANLGGPETWNFDDDGDWCQQHARVTRHMMPDDLILLIDGETGDIVPKNGATL